MIEDAHIVAVEPSGRETAAILGRDDKPVADAKIDVASAEISGSVDVLQSDASGVIELKLQDGVRQRKRLTVPGGYPNGVFVTFDEHQTEATLRLARE